MGLEFDPKLRALYPLNEIAFLHLECERLGGLWAAERIRRRLSVAHPLDANPRTPEKWQRLAQIHLKLAAADAARLERVLGSCLKVREA